MSDGLDFDYEDFKANAARERFYGTVVQHWNDGKLVQITVERSYKIKDFSKVIEFNPGFL